MKQVKSYKQEKPTGQYDALVIGSGLGGLSTAAFLAKEGQRVLVLERHYTPGGFTHVFKRRGYEWDVGVHYVGEVHRRHSGLRRMFDYLAEDRLQWAEMGEIYDVIFFGKDRYELPAGTENFKTRMKEYFPEDSAAIDEYIHLVYQATRSGRMFFAEKAMSPFMTWLFGGQMRSGVKPFASRTTLEVLQELTSNKKLIAVLCGQFGDYGLPPGQSSFFMHAMLVRHYFHGGNYPVGGSSQIFESIAPAVWEAGGDIFVSAEVEEILVEKGKAVGVRMADGQEFRAPVVVSSTGVSNTYGQLLPKETAKSLGITEQMEEVKPSVSHMCLYLGSEHSTEELGLKKPNYWIYPERYDHDANVADFLADPEKDFPVIYISFPSAKDPDWENRYPGKATLDIITLAPYEWFSEWEDSRWKKRGEEYDAFKEKLTQRMLDKVYEYLPQLKGKIDFHELSSPLTTRHFVNYEHGEIYGLEHTPERFDARFLRAHTPVKKLFLTGQDLVTCGVGGALASGMLTASAILGKDLSKRLREH